MSVALITGAACGIGHATALAFARKGAQLVLCDVNSEELERTAAQVSEISTCLLARRVDISKHEEVEAFADEVHRLVPSLDVLVNNAGVYIVGGILDLSLDDWEWVLGVNLRGVIHCCHYFVPAMVQRGQGGHVINVSSMYGFWPAGRVTGYLTSKFGVFGFSEALREDLRGTGIGVSTVCPGVINTNLVQSTRLRNTGNADALRDHLQRIYDRRNYGPEKVAGAIVRAVERNRRLVLVSPEARIMYHMNRLCPPLSRIIARASTRRMFG
ncbi:MAG TPA: SDR family NAD(P)-dependent oxidoreductase [Candidatus Hydrogenedentes bacterium]|nr:SDR family NAD(P)-dependent oxidoreductase [Candidatus Hydrogenedentota bacterium]HPC15392.1 SDR family NAD(P)-dependent oxidoreductase [Candidatus Hydrogenedentota bacterium]HRT19347.1 SDR family NAD(P)-dependent oxidoreductase [Candidatus Hydrogenedentota bacterium]HRT63427.1 SDR family NAD(P)-dependent oxidoreductase [Candidatus Hydrogenedentota bacterium]